MQGVEIVNRILLGIPEVTYPDAALVNSIKGLKPEYEIVVAQYNENLAWLKPYANNCLVYHKGGQSGPQFPVKRWEALPNVGRESHTYLYHIIEHYYSLADITLFLQPDFDRHKSRGGAFSNIKHYFKHCKRFGFGFSTHTSYGDSAWGKIENWIPKWERIIERGEMRRTNQTLGEFWESIFGVPHPVQYRKTFGGIFAVSRKRIMARPKSFYEKVMSYVSDHPNPEEGHYLERLWVEIFSEPEF